MNKRFLLLLCVLIGLDSFLPSPSSGQYKYSPDDSRVQQMAEKASAYLANYRGTDPGERVLAALAIVEVSKRYQGNSASRNPLVQSAIAEVLETVDRLDREHSMYMGALSTVLLCEVGKQKYAHEIRTLVDWITSRQNDNGGWGYHDRAFICDTSQSQYACLALFVANQHEFKTNPIVARRALEFLIEFQNPSGSWYYQYTLAGTVASRIDETQSLHCSGLGSVYLLADFLNLTPRVDDLMHHGIGLPVSVSVFIEPNPGSENSASKSPLADFDKQKLSLTKHNGNQWIADNFTVDSKSWNYYYLYSLERYAFFREQAEGAFTEVPNWYDQGVEHLRPLQQTNGAFIRGEDGPLNEWVSTALATLFLVRSSEVLVEPGPGLLTSGEPLPLTGHLQIHDGQIRSTLSIKSEDEMLALLDEDPAGSAQALVEATKRTMEYFASRTTQAEKLAILSEMVNERNHQKRMVAVKVIAGAQDMDYAPALIYALDDPSLDIAKVAHNGLRLTSRRINAFPLPDNPTYADFQVVQERWTEWFKTIRPDALLID